jgi:hypothetical protein
MSLLLVQGKLVYFKVHSFLGRREKISSFLPSFLPLSNTQEEEEENVTKLKK